MTERDIDFLGMFKDSLFVSIPTQGGALVHTKNLKTVIDLNSDIKHPTGAYFTVNGFANFQEGSYHGRTKANVTSFNANFLDIDLTPETKRMQAEIVLKELQQKGLPPTAIVLTGKGLHVYWLYTEPYYFSEEKLREYEVLQSAIVEHYKGRGSDPQARDAARVLRIPGGRYWNKNGTEGERLELMHYDPNAKYTALQVANYFKETVKTDTKEGQELMRLAGDDFDLTTILNVKKGGRHHSAYSAALSIVQASKTLTIARKWFSAVVSSWESPADDPLDWHDMWNQFQEAVKFLEKDRPQLFLGDAESVNIETLLYSDVEEKPVEWLWDGFIAKGKAHMLTGDPGLGKSQITVDIAARLSTGAPFPSRMLVPDASKNKLGVIILSAEDSAGDTIRPRLRAAGADLSKVVHMSSVIIQKDAKGKPQMRSLALREDAEQILRAIRQVPFEVGLIIIDPVSAFLSGSQDSNSNSDARGTLAQLQATVMDKGIAMLMINHNNKNTGAKSAHMRSMGSVGWNAAARATFYVFKDPGDEERRVFSVGKMNLAKDTEKGFFYRVKDKMLDVAGREVSVPYIEWDKDAFPTMSADEYTAAPSEKKQPKSDECRAELEMYMATRSEVPSKEGLKYMKERGFSQAEIYRTAREMGIIGEYGVWKK